MALNVDMIDRRHRPDRGFTLVEILIAIVLVGVLSAVAVVGIANLTSKGSAAACTASLDAAKTASIVHFTNTLVYPTTFKEMVEASPPELALASGVKLNEAAVGSMGPGTVATGQGWTLTIVPQGGGLPPLLSCSSGSASTSSSALILADSPTAYWRFTSIVGAAVPLAGGAGATLAATSGTGQSSPFSTGAAIGLSGGTPHSMTLPSSLTSGLVTVEFWMFPTGTNEIPISFGPGAGGTASLWLRPEGFGFNMGNSDIWGVPPPPLNAWIHVVAVFPNGPLANARLFLNGVEQTLTQRYGTTSTAYPNLNTQAYVDSFGPNAFVFNGGLAELAIYSGAPDPARIAAHAAATTP